MPQDLEFQLPCPSRINPDLEAARIRSLRWVRQHHLVTNSIDERRFLAWDIAGLMAGWAPLATGQRLDLLANAMAIGTLLDDQFDKPIAEQPEQVEKVCAGFRTVALAGARACSAVPAGAGPLARAFADVWSRICAGASPYWCARAAEHWRWILDSYVEEARNRMSGRIPTLDEYYDLRRRSGYVHAMLDWTEAAYGFETNGRTYEMPVVQRMLDITSGFVAIGNDLHSLEKEEQRGDKHNLVTVIANEQHCTREQGLAETIRLIDSWCAEFVQLERQLDEACTVNQLTDDETATAHRLTDCMGTAMRGYLDWGNRTERYSRLIPGEEPAYVARLL